MNRKQSANDKSQQVLEEIVREVLASETLQKNDKSLVGLWTAFALMVLLSVLALTTESIPVVKTLTSDFFTGNPGSPYGWFAGVKFADFGVFAGFAVFSVIAGITSGLIAGLIAREPSGIRDLFSKGVNFATFTWTMIAEELLARVLFIGIAGSIFNNPVATYILVFTGNAIWALLHLYNFEKPEDRKIVKVLPQFVSGILYSIVFLHYGLMAVVFVHFAYNAVVMAMLKEEHVSSKSLIGIAYYIMVATIVLACGVNFEILRQIVDWYNSEHNIHVSATMWSFGDYLLIVLFTGSIFNILHRMLLFDSENKIVYGVAKNPVEFTLTAILGSTIVVLAFVFLNWLFGFFIADNLTRVLLVAFGFAGILTAHSGSKLSASFWASIKTGMITVPVILFAGIGWGILIFAISIIIDSPMMSIAKEPEPLPENKVENQRETKDDETRPLTRKERQQLKTLLAQLDAKIEKEIRSQSKQQLKIARLKITTWLEKEEN